MYPVFESVGIVAKHVTAQPPAVHGAVPLRGFCREFAYQPVVFYVFESELIGCLVPLAEGLHVHELSRSYLVMDVSGLRRASLLHVSLFELKPRGIRIRYHIKVQHKREPGNDSRRCHIGHKHTPVAHSAREDGYDFGIGRLARGVEYYRDKYEQRAEHIYEIRYEIQVIVYYNGL